MDKIIKPPNIISGYIKNVIYTKENKSLYDDNDENIEENRELKRYYMIVNVIDDNYNNYKIKGEGLMTPDIGDSIILQKYEIMLDKYDKDKRDYNAIGLIDINLPTKRDKIINRLLSDELKVAKITKKTIEKLVDKYGSEIWNIKEGGNELENNLIKKIELYKNLKCQKESDKYQNISNYFLVEFNIILGKKLDKVVKLFDVNKVELPLNEDIIKQNIYDLVSVLDQKNIEIIVKILKIDKDTIKKIEILNILYRKKKYGNTCIKLSKLKKDCNDCEKCLKELENENHIKEYNDYIYLYNEYLIENEIASIMKEYKLKSKEKIIDVNNDTIDYNDKTNNKVLSDDQINGVKNALQNCYSIITGYPGVGKTTTIKSIVKICKEYNKNIIILAPTGKVVLKISKDLDELYNDNVYTIHRFLNCLKLMNKSDKDIYKFKHLYKIDVLVIDEMSMVTNELFRDLLFELDVSNDFVGNLVFVGDVEQLPAIGAGNVLNSLLNSKQIPKTELKTQQRSKGDLYTAILDIRKNVKPNINNDIYRHIKINLKEHCKNKLYEIINSLLDSGSKFDDIMIITPTNNNVKYFTEDLRKIINKNVTKDNEKEFVIGDYIMIKENFYGIKKNIEDSPCILNKIKEEKCKGCKDCVILKTNKNLYNGMTGIIAEYKDGYYKINIREDNGINLYISNKYINDYISFSYVNTVHKYQGSENKIGIILLTENDGNMTNKNLLYTAVSRASTKCIIIADEKVYIDAIKKNNYRVSKLDLMINDIFNKEENNDVNKPIEIILKKKNVDNKKDLLKI